VRVAISIVVCALTAVLSWSSVVPQAASSLPSQLSDAEFWRIFTEFSEPSGNYPYENFVTNEETIQDIMSVLTTVTRPGGVYLGVAPEQNFTYIAGIKPRMAFVLDIRRQNAIELLMYKALFELSPTRADFVSRLFSIKTTDKVPATARANSLFLAIDGLKGDKKYFDENLAAVKANLAKHKFALSAEDLEKVALIYDVFYRGGPQIDHTFSASSPAGVGGPTYIQSMTDTDADRKAWSFLATEENYKFVRDMQLRNAIIPIVGDFGGPKAIRKVAEYLKQHNAIVSAFYVSNVEAYIEGTGGPVSRTIGSPEKLQAFYRNAAELPVDRSSLFIRFVGAGGAANIKWSRGGMLQAVSPMIDLRDKIKAGAQPSYYEMLQVVPDPKTLATQK
jgi:hypothetical protein